MATVMISEKMQCLGKDFLPYEWNDDSIPSEMPLMHALILCSYAHAQNCYGCLLQLWITQAHYGNMKML